MKRGFCFFCPSLLSVPTQFKALSSVRSDSWSLPFKTVLVLLHVIILLIIIIFLCLVYSAASRA